MENGGRALIDGLRGRRSVALTGAGVSTESGIPDYRSPEARPRTPIRGPEFVRSAAVRRRYWARSMVGWEKLRAARPGAAHVALAALEQSGAVAGIITQNVDGLHGDAGSRRVVELHGSIAEVVCLACGTVEPRAAVQARMRAQNGDLLEAPAAPDGDADLAGEQIDRVVVPVCLACGGVLKPRVVFFGDNVPRPVVDEAFALLAEGDALLVAGTSLAVFSGYRFLLRAVERGMPVVIINRGSVRGEEHAVIKVEASTGETLAALARELTR
jgi:NAD-dependent SIR2 family protein deacetylase